MGSLFFLTATVAPSRKRAFCDTVLLLGHAQVTRLSALGGPCFFLSRRLYYGLN